MNRELLEKARQAKSPEELLALAKENDIELSDERAKALFDTLNGTAELSDEELANAAGGGGCSTVTCPKCKGTSFTCIGTIINRGKIYRCNDCGNEIVTGSPY